MSNLTRPQISRLGGLAKSRGVEGRKRMREMSALATRKPGDRTIMPTREFVKTPAGRKVLARQVRESGVPREEILRVLGAL